MSDNHRTVGVVGAGVIGLAIAWRLAAAGYRVTVIDPRPARGASWVAGGMLAPITEAWPGEEQVLRLGAESLQRWPNFAAELSAEGVDAGLSEAGTLVASLDRADTEQLDMLADYLHSIGRSVRRASGRQVRRAEPGLGPSVQGGLLVPGDLAVDNRRLLCSLYDAAANRGVSFVREPAEQISATLVRTASLSVPAERVVIAAGAWSSRLHDDLANVIRPLKGEIVRLRARHGTVPPPGRTVRAVVEGRPSYLVPREEGGLVLGATQYEAGFDETVTARGVRELLDGAERIFPTVSEYELVETTAGLRASSVDNLPVIGELSDGVLAATGHHRNGFLLAPITADAIGALLAGEQAPPAVEAAHPGRLAQKEAVSCW